MKKVKKFKHAKPAKKEILQSKKTQILHAEESSSLNKQQSEKYTGKKNKNVFQKWLTKHDSDVQLILFPLILLVILIILAVFNNQIFFSVAKFEPYSGSQITSVHPYPYVQAANSPIISAKAAIILDRASQVILFSKNPQLRFSMASTTKIMTALTALDYYRPTDILTVKRTGVPGSGLGLSPQEQFRFIDLMYAMLLPSANDAAQTIADNYPGGEDTFVRQMNEKAKTLHLTNTHYADPTGLDDDGDYSTVVDMARLASYAIENPTFVEVTSTKYKTIYSSNFGIPYSLTNLNKLLGIDGVTGIKTGTTEGAGEVLVTSVSKNSHTYIIIVMDSTDRFYDTSLLLNYIDTNIKYIMPSMSPE